MGSALDVLDHRCSHNFLSPKTAPTVVMKQLKQRQPESCCVGLKESSMAVKCLGLRRLQYAFLLRREEQLSLKTWFPWRPKTFQYFQQKTSPNEKDPCRSHAQRYRCLASFENIQVLRGFLQKHGLSCLTSLSLNELITQSNEPSQDHRFSFFYDRLQILLLKKVTPR